ncbi:MAG TPA: APC family permease [Candidatus Omnitrophota bacterium]|nr:APC family permease [Candidatus Omnitrophota bacterium]
MPFLKTVKNVLIGKSKDPQDRGVFHRLSLIAFFAWVGLGADGLSSSCYGPEEAFLALGSHPYLSIFIAAASALTVILISTSYSQIIELFPSGGGGYLVASKLLNPTLGMISGCALLVDYVFTITISLASGADAVFSFLPPEWLQYKLEFAMLGVVVLTTLNLRGVRESVVPLVPVFLTFVVTHVFVILYTIFINLPQLPVVMATVGEEVTKTRLELGFWGMLFLMMKAYSTGAGTYTGIETVSNGLSILREPRVQTGKRTMRYIAISLSFTVVGLILAYLLFQVSHVPGKTLNAALFETISKDWGEAGQLFVLVTLFSEATLLFVAAQAGFIGGPRVLANMALDRWFPIKFASLSDRLVTKNGIMLMGGAALLAMLMTHGSVKFLVVLYSINVFITFCLSQAGMVRHWWSTRAQGWVKKILINGSGLVLCVFILVSVVIIKFNAGGWSTLLITGSIVYVAIRIKRHYRATIRLLGRLDDLIKGALNEKATQADKQVAFDPQYKAAVILVNGFNGLGLHTLLNVVRLFGKEFKNFVFVEVGVIDAGNFKGNEEMENLRKKIHEDVSRYARYMRQQGFYAEGLSYVGLEVMQEVEDRTEEILAQYPNAVFFGGQLVFAHETFMNRWLHNYTVFALQRMFYHKGIPFVLVPIRV